MNHNTQVTIKIKGNLNIRIHRDITGPPKDVAGKPARRVVWQVRRGLGWGSIQVQHLVI